MLEVQHSQSLGNSRRSGMSTRSQLRAELESDSL
ncbi:unnamed protein product [Acanthoscelides obtectus]|uniref:Uncharacterized protein n=1 Tax=Acanthoscelides obtectus TaxID=200917 RepID=A0A9P0JPH2_ACAOB|nr:unnamed protein product [Acanthoscelides obtectus]CAK1665817.1 hypothetical protein AOBTE_LOCUS24978 [Acanthoscelides obtectus]